MAAIAATSPTSRPSSAVSSSQQQQHRHHHQQYSQQTRRNDAHYPATNPFPVRSPDSCGNSISSSLNQHDVNMGEWRNVRTLPTWVQRREDDDEDSITMPPMVHRRPPGRSVHDAQREATPVTPSHPSQHASRWKSYVENTQYPPNTAHSEKMDVNWLAQQGDLNTPWLASANAENGATDGAADDQEALWSNTKKKRRIWYKRIHIILLNSPTVPLTLRAIVWLLSLLALSLAGSIFHLSDKYGFPQKPSTVMAIVVDVLALVYLIYITWDEYSGKPLGLRSPKAKIRLLMLDLLFIVFDSANLSLAFDTLYDVRWSCRSSESLQGVDGDSGLGLGTDDPICDRQRALSAFLFLALCAWVATFMVSVFRVVERVSQSSTR